MKIYDSESVTEESADNSFLISREEFEKTRFYLEEIINKGNMVERLISDEDFKKIIIMEYMIKEKERISELIASGNIKEKKEINYLASKLASIGNLKNFLNRYTEEAKTAKNELSALENMREESIRREEQKLSEGNI